MYEAAPLGFQLPQVIPLMPDVSLNTTGTRPLKVWRELKDKGPEELAHHDSKVDKFDKRLVLVRKQRERGDLSVAEEEVRDVSLYVFY